MTQHVSGCGRLDAEGVVGGELPEAQEIICTSCPRGCPLQVRILQNVVEVRGSACRRGRAYGEAEVRDPRRVLTTTVGVIGGSAPVAPVRTQAAIPRDRIAQALAEIRGVRLSAPVRLHQVVLESVAGTGVSVIVTRPVPYGTSRAPMPEPAP